MSIVARAIKDERWELAALCLLIGLMKAASLVPRETLVSLMEMLEREGHAQKG